MIIGASSFASSLPELRQEVESIELYVPKLRIYNGTQLVKERVTELKDMLSDSNTTIHAPYFGDTPGYPRELAVDTARMGRTQFRLMQESISLAQDLGSGVVVLHPGKITGDRDDCFRHMVQNLRKLAIAAEDCGVILGLENLAGTDPSNFCAAAREHMLTIKEVDSPFLKATFDIGHANLTCGGDSTRLRNFVNELGDNVVHVHVHDNNGMPGGMYFGDSHGAPGEGSIDFSVLMELRFKRIYNLEVFTMEGVRTGKQVLSNLQQRTLDRYVT